MVSVDQDGMFLAPLSTTRRRWISGAVASMMSASMMRVDGALALPRHPRVAVLAQWITETILALDITPAALPELSRASAAGQRLPIDSGAVDLGFIGEPNLELLDQLQLDFIFIEAGFQSARWEPILSRIAPVVVGSIYSSGLNPLEAARKETLRFGSLLSTAEAARRFVDQVDDVLDRSAARPAPISEPLFVLKLVDDRNVMLFCGGSMFDDVLKALGLKNASTASNNWGFLTTGIEMLASVPEARIVYFEPVPKEAERLFSGPSLWSHLPSVQRGRITAIPELYSWGALQTAKRFAEALAKRLPRESTG